MSIKRLFLATLLLITPAACSRSETPKEEEKQVAMAEPPPVQQPEQQPPAAEAPPAQLQSEAQAPAETAPAPVERPRARQQQPTRRAQQPADETYTPPQASQGTTNDQTTEREPIVPPSPSRRGGTGVPADASLDSGRTATNIPVTPPVPTTAMLPEGTVIDVRLDDRLSSATNQVGDTFNAILDRDLIVDGKMLAPKGSRVTGKVTDVAGSGKVKGLAHMTLALTAIRIGEERFPVTTSTISVEAENTKARDAKTIGAGAAIGAAIGAIAGGKKGAAIGGAVGGGAGTAGVLATKGKEVEFQPEHKFSFRLEKEVEMKIR